MLAKNESKRKYVAMRIIGMAMVVVIETVMEKLAKIGCLHCVIWETASAMFGVE